LEVDATEDLLAADRGAQSGDNEFAHVCAAFGGCP
jgi:hypothetical protein